MDECGRMDEWTSGRVDEWTDGRVDEWMHRRTDGQSDGQSNGGVGSRMDRGSNEMHGPSKGEPI